MVDKRKIYKAAKEKPSDVRRRKEEEVVEYLKAKAGDIRQSELFRSNKVVTTTAGRETLFLDQFRDAIKGAFAGKLAVPKILKKPAGKAKRILNLLISDTHYGSALDPREVGHKYGSAEEARRTAAVCREVAGYKLQYRAETELYVHLLGDIIQGQLHDMRDGLPLTEQVASAVRILTQAIRYFAVQFPRGVTVFCTPGNHGRNSARHKDRAVNQRWDSIETMIYIALKEAARFMPNVNVKIGYEPKYDFDMFGALGFATHGDTVINPGYPGKSINVESLKRQINDINNARAAKNKKPYKVFVVGHVHVGSMTNLPGGVTVITNGCLIPPDAYANSIGIFDTANGQWLWESVEGHPVGDSRFINVGEADDVDESLDSIIAPFDGI